MSGLYLSNIKNILLDINGVLFNSGTDGPINGSVEAIEKLEFHNYNICLVTNECTTAKRLLAKKLQKYGYKTIDQTKIISPAPVACEYLLKNNLIPRLHVYDGILEDFKPAIDYFGEKKMQEPNCLVVGDVMTKLSQDLMDESLDYMLKCQNPQIVSLGAGRYYLDAGKLRMDTGCYVAAFEFGLGRKAINLGKPSELLFDLAMKTVKGTVNDTMMVGDDIISDIGGAQAYGMQGVLVRTGKYRLSDEQHTDFKANAVFDNLLSFANFIVGNS